MTGEVNYTDRKDDEGVAAATALEALPEVSTVILITFGQDRRRTGSLTLRTRTGIDDDILVATFRHAADVFEREAAARQRGAKEDAGGS